MAIWRCRSPVLAWKDAADAIGAYSVVSFNPDNHNDITLTLSTHNVNGYRNSKEFLHSRCDDATHAIYAIQEHWLKPPVRRHPGVNLLKSLHPKFDGFGSSAMTNNMNTTILKGRPFGGTGFVFSRNLSHSLRPRTDYIHDRVSVMEMSTSRGMTLLINAYLPFYDTRNLDAQTRLFKDTIAFIDNIIHSNVNCSFILLMDMNCNIYKQNHNYSRIIRDLMQRNGLISAFDLIPGFDPDSNYTRCDVKTNSYTLIDGVLLSDSIADIVDSVSIAHLGNNVSDHSPVDLTLKVRLELFPEQKKVNNEFIPWSSLSESELSLFRDTMEQKLRNIHVPFHSILHGHHNCSNTDHLFEIEKYYNMVIEAIRDADMTLPRRKCGKAKHFWSSELSMLKRKSIDACNLWKLSGRPGSGPIHVEKNSTNLQYKKALRKAKNESESTISDSLSDAFMSKSSDKFWKSWNNITPRDNEVSCVDGFMDHRQIANAFARTFSNVFHCTNVSAETELRKKFQTDHTSYSKEHQAESIHSHYISWSEFLACITNITTGKASGGFAKPYHILYGTPSLALHLHLLFNAFIQHSYVPHEFLCSIVSPVVKNTSGNFSDSSNYRPITLSSLFSQIFERAIKMKIGHLLETDDLQFGFKPKHSTSHALFTLTETVNYFNKHGSSVIASFLDCSKAFDKISHAGLFIKLMQRNVPLCFINLLVYWMSNLTSRCRWQGFLSDSYAITSGVKQGGVLSPLFFNVYVNDLILKLKTAGSGCYIDNLFLGAIMFADDLVLLAPTRGAMQNLISVCERFSDEHCLSFNAKKTKAMIFGKTFDKSISPVLLNSEPVQFVDQWEYLGCSIVSGKELGFSTKKVLSSFRCSANSILTAVKKPTEPVLMRLLYSFSVPILTYASEVKSFSATDMHDCTVALNDSIRKIFSFHRWESIRTLRIEFGYLDLTTIFAQRRSKFLSQMHLVKNRSLSALRSLPT